ncbi:NADPH2:quinone reductase [Arthrobacter sp. P2b]|nr:NAD(P)H-quinone oxidoreductase [Arthrobacter sp. P2b]SLK14181.1 NADPH2:quinone reductase [Arthrobacter sp. P2b]
MKAVRFRTPGGPETLAVEELPDPRPQAGEVLIRIAGAGLNRADSLQRLGRHNLPPGASEIFGMEVSGTIVEAGPGIDGFIPGDQVMALLASGGYAEYVAVSVGHVLAIPKGIGLIEVAGVPEVAATLVSNICHTGRFAPGETVLIHGATGGIGVFGIQLIKTIGGRVAVTASSDTKLEVARRLGADILINYEEEDFAKRMLAEGGADIVLDTVGGSYLAKNIEALAPFGRIMTIGMQGGPSGTLNFAALMKKKASVSGTLLRDRSPEQKTAIMAGVNRLVLPFLTAGAIRLITERVYPLSEVAAAHAHFETKAHVGKILLDCRQTD